jgi:arabinan endo-1,5-alpha-L-arabinosidase
MPKRLATHLIWDGYLADPMALRTPAGYFIYGTGGPDGLARSTSGREFPVLKSNDLEGCEFLGGALSIAEELNGMFFWAPEVAEREGKYFLYYSAGGIEGQGHKVRLATSDAPQGPFVGSKIVIPEEPFTIDAHPFLDPVSGQWFLFFAKDFLEEPTGTGIAVARLNDDMSSIQGPTVPVLQGQANWQIFERNRFWYDRMWSVWYCVEGPFVVYRDGRYWMFYSGGNWHASHYGVGCAVADRVTGPYRALDVQGGANVLRTGHGLWGPGHCSLVVDREGTDCVCFHAWNSDYTVRRVHIAPLEWTNNGPVAIVKSLGL